MCSCDGKRTGNGVHLQWASGHRAVYLCNESEDMEQCTSAMGQRTWNSVLLQWGGGHGTVYFCNGAEDMEQCTSAMGLRIWNSVLLLWDRGQETVYFCNGTEENERCTYAMGQRTENGDRSKSRRGQTSLLYSWNWSILYLRTVHYTTETYSSHLQLLHFADGIVHAKAWLQPRNTHTSISHLECQSFILKIIERN